MVLTVWRPPPSKRCLFCTVYTNAAVFWHFLTIKYGKAIILWWISETDFTNSTVSLKKPLTPSPFVWTIGIKFIKHCWVGGGGPPLGGICPIFPESLFFNSKARFGVQDENLKKSRLQDSFCVNFKSVLCQSYVNFMQKKTCIFFTWVRPRPLPVWHC